MTSKSIVKNIRKSIIAMAAIALTVLPASSEAAPFDVVKELGYSSSLGAAVPMGQHQTTRLSSGSVLWMESTAYSRFDPGCGDYTATGDFVRYGVAAVDPSVIPLGTSLYIDGYGHALALDTGGAIIGNRIDLAFDSYEEALGWGRRGVNVYIN